MAASPETDPVAAYRLLVADVYELAGASRASSEAVARRCGLTTARWHVLSVVSEAAATVPAIARRLGLTRQSVQRVVHDLVAEGHAALEANPAHERSPLVAASAAGAAALEQVLMASGADRAALVARAGVTAGELLAARATLRSLLDAFERD